MVDYFLLIVNLPLILSASDNKAFRLYRKEPGRRYRTEFERNSRRGSVVEVCNEKKTSSGDEALAL